ALDAGLLTVPFAFGQLLASPRSAGLVKRFGAKAVGGSGMVVMTVVITGYATLGVHSPIWVMCVLFAVQGAGMGVVMPAATAAIMDVLPREKAGSASALTNTARQVAVALSVAVLGSILAVAYRGSLGPSLAHLPAAIRDTASSSITATQAVATHLGPAGQALLVPANNAFVHAMHIVTLVAAGLALLGALVVLRWMPGKPAIAAAGPVVPAEPVTVADEAELALLTEDAVKSRQER
ncbi:MAG TPA: MFS transporter, partial [Streptosporangiaceae bacterium]|nr:MFS transporter [Streptosporangiaceae bacterium]